MSTTQIVMLGIYRSFGVDGGTPIKLAASYDLASFSFFYRSIYREHLTFGTRTLARLVQSGTRQTVELDKLPFFCHIYSRHDGLVGVVVANQDYNERVAQSLIHKLLGDFEKQSPDWKSIKSDQDHEPEFMKRDIVLYQKPHEADKILAIHAKLFEIEAIMHKNIQDLMTRGDTIDSLMAKSEDLSSASMTFGKTARKLNKCSC